MVFLCPGYNPPPRVPSHDTPISIAHGPRASAYSPHPNLERIAISTDVTYRTMDENLNPNLGVHGASDVSSNGTKPNSWGDAAAVADTNAPLVAVLGALEDGQVAISGDLVAIRAGPETYHPIKALKVMPHVFSGGMAAKTVGFLLPKCCLGNTPTHGHMV